MAKKLSTLPLSLRGPKPGMPLYRWLYEELRARILAGQLRPGMRLPATRDLAVQYGLSRPTIVTAFEQLRSEGYVEGRVGSGTYVSQTLPDELLQAPRARSAQHETPPPDCAVRLRAQAAEVSAGGRSKHSPQPKPRRQLSPAGVPRRSAGARCFSG